MLRETLIDDFLDRLENTFSANVECCESANDTIHAIRDAGLLKPAKNLKAFDYEQKCTAHGNVEFDRDAARAALDRLFRDLADFVKEPKKTTKRKSK